MQAEGPFAYIPAAKCKPGSDPTYPGPMRDITGNAADVLVEVPDRRWRMVCAWLAAADVRRA